MPTDLETGATAPEPVLPRSSTTTFSVSEPLKLVSGVNRRPLRATLTSAISPRKTSVPSLPSMSNVPSASIPNGVSTPAVVPSVSDPLVTLSDTCTSLGLADSAASISATVIAFPDVTEKISGVSSLMVCGPGTATVGASFTAAMRIGIVRSSISGPPFPVLP